MTNFLSTIIDLVTGAVTSLGELMDAFTGIAPNVLEFVATWGIGIAFIMVAIWLATMPKDVIMGVLRKIRL